MGRALLDTSYFTALEQQRQVNVDVLPELCAISVVTVGELRQGVLAAEHLDERARRLETLSSLMAFDPLPIDTVVAATWSALKVKLKAAKVSIGANDVWIAATALAYQVPLVTQDRGFEAVPDLEVILA